MKIIVGLGNPGKEYEQTPHNVGFRVVDTLVATMHGEKDMEYAGAQRHRLYTLEEFWTKNGRGERERIVLFKPQTFMNESGSAVKEYLRYHGNDCEAHRDLWIVHDDGDIALGSLRLDTNKRAAGHNGVQSMFDHLGTKDMIRFRFGIRPEGSEKKTADYVVRRIPKSQQEVYEKSVERMVDGLLLAVRDTFEHAQIFLNTKRPTKKPLE